MDYNEIDGDLIELAKEGKFDVIAHGCNCFCNMGAGIAPQMAKTFFADRMIGENQKYRGDIDKLGTIDHHYITDKGDHLRISNPNDLHVGDVLVTVVNAYTQYGFGRNHPGGKMIPLDYEALTLCMRKINHKFKGEHIGLPKIGAGLAGGDWERIKKIIQDELIDCKVTVVNYVHSN
jgi:O-acetyl-ADP-ribose deacetylase (regulator of RNase III)